MLSGYEELIAQYHDFARTHRFNMVMAMDFARKYTYKKGERRDALYRKFSSQFSQDLSSNLQLLSLTLDCLKETETDAMIYAPARGATPQQYEEYVGKVLELERNKGMKFHGFALGGIVDYRSKNDEIWNVPPSASRRVKAGIIVMSGARAIRRALERAKDHRPVHALGAGDVSNIIPLVVSGADTFDCHTPWRRATDGNKESAKFVFEKEIGGKFSKYLIPAIDSKSEVIVENKEELWNYVKLPEVPDDIVCDCDICRKFSIKEIKQLYSNLGEDYYFARMLMYVHAILQHDLLCKRLAADIEEEHSVFDTVNEIPDEDLRKDLLYILRFNPDSSKHTTLPGCFP